MIPGSTYRFATACLTVLLACAVLPSGATATPLSDAVPLPASPFTGNVSGTVEKIYGFTLAEDEVLHAFVEQTGTGAFVVAEGFSSAAADTASDFALTSNAGTGAQEVFVPAEYGSDTYYLSVRSPQGVSAEYTVTYEVVRRGSGTARRIDGRDRYAVAANAAQEAFPGWAGITDVILASGEDRAMADPLAASGLAGAYRAPILLVMPRLADGKLPGPTENALAAIRNANGGRVAIHVVGGGVSVPSAVLERARALTGGGGIERISGRDRYELSAAMAKRTRDLIVSRGGTVDHVMVANGDNPAAFYDALAASPIAYRNAIPIMLSATGSLPAPVKLQLDSTFRSVPRYLVSSPQYLSAGVKASTGAAYNISDHADRYNAAFDIADWAYVNGLLEREKVGVANKLPDALTGGVAMGQQGAPILYTPADRLDGTTTLLNYWNKGAIDVAYVLGGSVSISPAALTDLGLAVSWPY